MTNIAAASTSPKMSGISSDSRSCLQITHTRRPDGISASIRYEPSRRGSRWTIRLYAASTSSADRAWAAIFSRFHSIHLNRRMRAAYQRGQSSTQRDPSGGIRPGRHTHKAGSETALALGFSLAEHLRSAARDLGLSIGTDFIASPLHRFVRPGHFFSLTLWASLCFGSPFCFMTTLVTASMPPSISLTIAVQKRPFCSFGSLTAHLPSSPAFT